MKISRDQRFEGSIADDEKLNIFGKITLISKNKDIIYILIAGEKTKDIEYNKARVMIDDKTIIYIDRKEAIK